MLAVSCQLPVPNDPKSREPKKNFYTATSFTSHLNMFISWAKFQHTLPSAGAKGASFSLSLTPLLPFLGFLFLFFSVLPPPLSCPRIRRSPGLKILHMIPMAEIGIHCPHQTVGSWEHLQLTLQNNFPSLYWLPKEQKRTVIQKMFLSPDPTPKTFPSFSQTSFEGTYLAMREKTVVCLLIAAYYCLYEICKCFIYSPIFSLYFILLRDPFFSFQGVLL